MDSLLLYGKELIVIIVSYALGCFSTGYYLVRQRTGQDIRQLGSGSTGGTNVGRVLGKPGFAVTMLGDMLKGALALWIALYLGAMPWSIPFVILASVTGHIFPVQLGWRGGKGLSPAIGALLVVDYRLVIYPAIIAGLLGVMSRQFTLSLMVVIAIVPFIAAIMGYKPVEVLGLAMTALLLLIAHRTNILMSLKRIRIRTHTFK